MKRISLFTALLSGLLIHTAANATVIDFTEVFSDPPQASHTLVGDEWEAYGIHTANAYWYADTRDPFDQMGLANSSSGIPAVVTFLDGTNAVTIDWITIISNTINIDAYNGAGTLLDSFSYAGTGTESGTVTLAGAGISYLEWYDSGGTVSISTLTFNEVPAPATLLLMGLGLVGIGFAKQKKAA
jgi:hypothetical protein